MKEQAVIHNTFVIERSYATTPERVFAAFSDPAKRRRWFAEGDHHEIEEFEMDFRTGGREHLVYRFRASTPFPGVALTNDAIYQEIVPNSRIVMSTGMTIGNKFVSASLLTFEFPETDKGTDMIFTHQGAFLEGSGGPEMRQGGWQTLFGKLAAEIGS